MKNVLLLNPPGDKIYIRDFYCSHISKGAYIYYPIDLTVLSGIIGSRFNVNAIDAVAERMTYKRCFDLIMSMDIDLIIFLTGAVSWKKDFDFLRKISEKKKDIKFVGNGDILLTNGKEVMDSYPFLDGIILDFTSEDILKFLDGEKKDIDSMTYRNDKGIVLGRRKLENKTFSLPLPKLELFPTKKYSIPTAKRLPYATVMASDGCAFKCDFCLCGELGYRHRDIDNLINELKYVRNLGIREIRFRDNTFGIRKDLALELCNKMVEDSLNLSWSCLSRVDVMNDDLLKQMKRAGCHTIQFGVESGDAHILSRYKKGISIELIRSVFANCRKLKIKTLAHFLIGLPNETEESVDKTIALAKELYCDIASFNIVSPRLGTELRKEAVKKGWTDKKVGNLDNSISFPAMKTDTLSRGQIWKLRNKAIKKFYFRPRYLLKLIFRKRSLAEIKAFILDGVSLIKSLVIPYNNKTDKQ